MAKHKRNMEIVLLALPIIVFVFFAGWAMYVTGQTKGDSHYA
jgi:hypothetical protein